MVFTERIVEDTFNNTYLTNKVNSPILAKSQFMSTQGDKKEKLAAKLIRTGIDKKFDISILLKGIVEIIQL